MAVTPSTMLALGTQAPLFSLPSPDGSRYTLLQTNIRNGLLVIFICNHCPYVLHIREKLFERCRCYQQQGIEVATINSNDFIAYPDDSPEKMLAMISHFNLSFPYLIDEDQQIAKAYKAACTPDFFLFDKTMKLVYRGQFDAARPGNNEPVNGDDLDRAVDAMLKGGTITADQRPSMGCSIKWKRGNEPQYF